MTKGLTYEAICEGKGERRPFKPTLIKNNVCQAASGGLSDAQFQARLKEKLPICGICPARQRVKLVTALADQHIVRPLRVI